MSELGINIKRLDAGEVFRYSPDQAIKMMTIMQQKLSEAYTLASEVNGLRIDGGDDSAKARRLIAMSNNFKKGLINR